MCLKCVSCVEISLERTHSLQTITANINEAAFIVDGVCGITEVLDAFNNGVDTTCVAIVAVIIGLFFVFPDVVLCVKDRNIYDWSTITYIWVELYATGRIHQIHVYYIYIVCIRQFVRGRSYSTTDCTWYTHNGYHVFVV